MTFEKHYRIKELATLWSLSRPTVTALFATEPGCLRIQSIDSGKRSYTTISIPDPSPHGCTSDSATSRSRRALRRLDQCA
jgi:hypothetical protein